MKPILYRTLLLSLIISLISSCGTDFPDDSINLEPSFQLIIRLTDAPGDFEEVNVEIQEIKIKTSEGWVELESFVSGIYNLLELQNGVEEVLVDEEFPIGNIIEIRVILGDENTVVVDGEIFDLKTPSAQKSGVKNKVGSSNR